jgi:ribosome-associated translation inhibitor RaiA
MEQPLQVTFKNVPHSEAIEAACAKHAEKLDALYDRILACRVVVSAQHGIPDEGRTHSYHLTLIVPGEEIVITRDSEDARGVEDDRRALRETFERARRRLDEFLDRRRERGRTA